MKQMIVFYGGGQFAMYPIDNYSVPSWAKHYIIFEFVI